MQEEIKYIPPEEIIYDPIMCKRYIEAINAQINYEIELVRRRSDDEKNKL